MMLTFHIPLTLSYNLITRTTISSFSIINMPVDTFEQSRTLINFASKFIAGWLAQETYSAKIIITFHHQKLTSYEKQV